ncbi:MULTISPECIES: Tim44 domain-containing protein [Rhodomicrobium]|uniref:Tim44 domain-containing protein n=1 Tax=Rhodomicrobium TaxID=1068 RepID=UPI000B4B12D1|nr:MULTISPECIES: Tim44 domain-containing protein [Rhodomicrobium]
MSFPRLTVAALGLATGLAMVTADTAEARLGRGGSFGSRAGRTYTAPPATTTAPKAAPIERSMTQKPSPGAQSAQPGAQTGVAQPSRFGGFRGLLLGGLFAAGLAGIFGFGALASVLGFVLQFALIAGAIYLVVAFIRSRSQPALARATYGAGGRPQGGTTPASFGAGGGAAPSTATLALGEEDFNSFERLLGEIQLAYGREDTEELGSKTTPEMFSYFSKELHDNAQQGVRNEISDVKLLQGDLSEAWRENGSDYATVAMRFSLVDAMVDRKDNHVVSGDRSHPTEATELWTFRRDDRARQDGWQLSAIQQAA